jgi:hypothetical protein
MRTWFGKVVRLVSGAALVYACAGKSLSNGDGDDNDNGNGGFANAGYGGQDGSSARGGTLGRGGTTGKGGSPGKGGSSGRGGSAGTVGQGGTGNAGGEPGTAGVGGCGGRFVGSVFGTCSAPAQCISMANPAPTVVRRNALAEPEGAGGQGGEGGDAGGSLSSAATARLCGAATDDDARDGYLAFDYLMPEEGTQLAGFTLTTGTVACQGSVIATGTLAEFSAPPRGWWSTQCIAVAGSELESFVTVVVPHVSAPYPSVRNLRFVSGCQCARQIQRFDTCGDDLSPQVCI